MGGGDYDADYDIDDYDVDDYDVDGDADGDADNISGPDERDRDESPWDITRGPHIGDDVSFSELKEGEREDQPSKVLKWIIGGLVVVLFILYFLSR